jgi:hypothetical protein
MVSMNDEYQNVVSAEAVSSDSLPVVSDPRTPDAIALSSGSSHHLAHSTLHSVSDVAEEARLRCDKLLFVT